MGKIRSMTLVDAPVERCFQLSLSVDLHKAATGEAAIAGVTEGLIGPGSRITWQGRGKTSESLVSAWRPFIYFREVLTAGWFQTYQHDHHFAPMNDGTRIRDEIEFTLPKGFTARLAFRFFIRKRLVRLLKQRNAMIKSVAESEEWHRYLDGQPEIDRRVYQAITPPFAEKAKPAYAD
ncbi:cell division protein [Granulicella sp. dw_53]|uniref:SRPBCC family protein n=1 Tax=Granulicella sp. dw_53 TaxID=2719792 RepID=UPI001BD4FBF5|nr:cell division protein [Granulicella sp. dw_53]